MKNIILTILLLSVSFACKEKEMAVIYIDFNYSENNLFAPARVTFYNYTSGANEFEWDFGDGGHSTEKEPVHTFVEIGSYDVTLTAKMGSSSKQITKSIDVIEESTEDEVGLPPSSLGLNSFYKKYIDADGIPVISSEMVPDEALLKVKSIIVHMMKNMEEVKQKMISFNARVGIMGKDEVTTDIPEHAFLANDQNTNWDTRARGLGGTVNVPITTCAEENVLCYAVDKYFNEDIFIHEFSHAIHLMGIQHVDANFNSKLTEALESALAQGVWANTYAGSNIEEYWAEGVQDWFNCNTESIPTNGVHNFVNTRTELKNYDSVLYEIIAQYFEEDDTDIISCHQK